MWIYVFDSYHCISQSDTLPVWFNIHPIDYKIEDKNGNKMADIRF